MKKGQHFIIDQSLLERIADYAELTRSDRVLEVGPGTGNLTKVIASRAGQVYAIEVDPGLAADLRGRFPNVDAVKGDASRIDLPEYNKIVSNLPYQISSKITLRFLSRPFELMVLMYQHEFAKRMLAKPGTNGYGRMAMIAGYLSRAELLEVVPRSAFRPVPAVKSAVVRLRPREHDVDAAEFIKFAEGLFGNRRKKIKKTLLAMGISRERLTELDASLLDMRPEELIPDEAAGLAKAIFDENPDTSS
ncbi:MAG: 16S rRNA (adenine(1518)-N(6)/adenine(1519)-N(6))-dimethyltransferase RsmA [Methanotrichaceae archaeon]